MGIALDIDGLLDEHPEFFRFLSTALRAQGHYVAIMEGQKRWKDKRTKGRHAPICTFRNNLTASYCSE
jgi:hypothetical protein